MEWNWISFIVCSLTGRNLRQRFSLCTSRRSHGRAEYPGSVVQRWCRCLLDPYQVSVESDGFKVSLVIRFIHLESSFYFYMQSSAVKSINRIKNKSLHNVCTVYVYMYIQIHTHTRMYIFKKYLHIYIYIYSYLYDLFNIYILNVYMYVCILIYKYKFTQFTHIL